MLELFVLNGQDLGDSATLAVGDSIGRNPDCALRLRDRSISRRHAVVEERADGLYLVDAGSTNGLTFQGARVAEVELFDGVEFLAGEVELRARLDRKPPSAGEPPAKTQRPAPPASPKPAAEPVFAFGGGVAARPTAGADEVDLELELDFEDEPAAPPPAERTPSRSEVTNAERAKILANLGPKKTTLLSGDLSQYPAWIQALALLGVLALGSAAVYFAFQFVVANRTG